MSILTDQLQIIYTDTASPALCPRIWLDLVTCLQRRSSGGGAMSLPLDKADKRSWGEVIAFLSSFTRQGGSECSSCAVMRTALHL